jgi:hypothetical protein
MQTIKSTNRCRFAAMLLAAACVGAAAVPGRDARAGGDGEEARDRALCARAAASPATLLQAVERVSAEGRSPLAADFLLDGDVLRLRVVTAGDLSLSHDFREFGGPVTASGWTPVERSLREPVEVAQAARWQVLLAQIELTLARGIASSSAVRTPAGKTVGAAPLSIRPARVSRKAVFEGLVGIDDVPWSVTHDATTGVVSADPPGYVLAREAEARKRVGKALPELTVEGGRWLNVETPPTLTGWHGEPALVLLTNFACEMECGPSAATVSKWARVYGKRGLHVVTIYREREEWNPHVTLEEAITKVKQAKAGHPVLIDPDDRYIAGLEPGPIGYPVAYVVGRDGLVAWEGDTSRLSFESACVKAIEAVLAPVPGGAAPGAPGTAPGSGAGR